jgi:hypothetical protein
MRWRKLIKMICPTRKAEYFFRPDWTTQIALKSLEENRWTRGADVDLFGRSAAFISVWVIAIASSPVRTEFPSMFAADGYREASHRPMAAGARSRSAE